jgi:hypothetical protein
MTANYVQQILKPLRSLAGSAFIQKYLELVANAKIVRKQFNTVHCATQPINPSTWIEALLAHTILDIKTQWDHIVPDVQRVTSYWMVESLV